MDLSRSEALDKAEAALRDCTIVRRYGVHPDADRLERTLRALITEHRRVLAELDEAHAHFQVQEARIREARKGAEPSARELLEAIYDPDLDDIDDSVRYGFILEQAERLRVPLTPDGQEKNR